MKLSSKSRYGVMALLDILNSEKELVSLSLISERQNLPMPYLEQLFLKLKRAGLVKSIRGVSGGYSLAKDPSLITVFDIFSAVDPIFKTKRCNSDGKGCHPDGKKCNAHDLWDELDQMFHLFCKSITLEHIKNKSECHVS
jgi:Rrf2 family iron-sulfur cluster assembly transcriptional regulator